MSENLTSPELLERAAEAGAVRATALVMTSTLESSKQVFSDLLMDYADDQFEPQEVEAARKRIHKSGLLACLAGALASTRRALQFQRKENLQLVRAHFYEECARQIENDGPAGAAQAKKLRLLAQHPAAEPFVMDIDIRNGGIEKPKSLAGGGVAR